MTDLMSHSSDESLCVDCQEMLDHPWQRGTAVQTAPDTIVLLCTTHRFDRLRRKARVWDKLLGVALSSALLAFGTVAAVGLWGSSPFTTDGVDDIGWASIVITGWSDVSAQASQTPLDTLAVLATITVAITVSMSLALAQRGQSGGNDRGEAVDLEREALIARLTTLAAVHYLLSAVTSVIVLLVLAAAVLDRVLLPALLAGVLWGWLITDMIRVNQVTDVAIWQRLFLRALQADSVVGIRRAAEKVGWTEALRAGASGAAAMIIGTAVALAPRWEVLAFVGAVTAVVYCVMIAALAAVSGEYLREGRRGSLVVVGLIAATFTLGFAQFTLIPLLSVTPAESWLQPWRGLAAVAIQTAVSLLTVLGTLGHGAGVHMSWFKPLACFTLRVAAWRDHRSRSGRRGRNAAHSSR